MSIQSAYVMPHPPIILPEVGHGEEAKLAKTTASLQKAAHKIAAQKPETIVVVSPHATMYKDYFHISSGTTAKGDMSQFGAPEVQFSFNQDQLFIETLANLAEEAGFPAGTMGQDGLLDHGTMIPLYFINQMYPNYKLMRVGISGLSPITHYCFGSIIAQVAAQLGRNTVLIASGDLSHKLKEDGPYGLSPDGAGFDEKVTDALAQGDLESFLSYAPAFCESAAECGLRSLQVLAGVFDETPITTELLSYEGPFGVGYAVATVDIADK